MIDAPTDPLDVRRGARRRRVPYAAGAAVLALLAGVGLAGAWLGEEPAMVADPPATSEAAGLPAPAPGTRWVSWRDVAVQVPEGWVYDHAPGEDWCADTPGRGARNPTPYVDTVPIGFAVTLAIGCVEQPEPGRPDQFGPAPVRLWQAHLSFEEPNEADATATWAGWTFESRTLGDVRIELLTDDPAATAPILASATRFGVDQHGCAATSPAQADRFVRPEPFDVTAVDAVDSISICQYDRNRALGTPGLMGSRRIAGLDAQALLRGLQDAPAGGGPDRPETCTHDDQGSTAVVVRLHRAQRTDDVYVYFDHCFGNGSDDGTTRRALTAETCAPLLKPPVAAYSFMSSLHGKCIGDS